MGTFDWDAISSEYLMYIPEEPTDPDADGAPLVYRRSNEVIVRRFGFVLWSTWEIVGTPKVDLAIRGTQQHPELICFVNAKSTRARTGLQVHFTAPTIHAGWAGNVVLEITNLGPFDFVLREKDAIAQLTVATISSAPDMSLRKSKQQTQFQTGPGAPPKPRTSRRGGPGRKQKS